MVLTVIVVGIILSKPFLRDARDQKPHEDVEPYKSQYRSLLEEINKLENQHSSGEIPPEAITMIDRKKQEAARLLRIINPHLD